MVEIFNPNNPNVLVKNTPWFKAKIAGQKDEYFWRHILNEPFMLVGVEPINAYYAAHDSVANAVSQTRKAGETDIGHGIYNPIVKKMSLFFKLKLRKATHDSVPLLQIALRLSPRDALEYWNTCFMPTEDGIQTHAERYAHNPTEYEIIGKDAISVTDFLHLKV